VSIDHVTRVPAPEKHSPTSYRDYVVCVPDVPLPPTRPKGHKSVSDRVDDWMWRDNDASLLKVRVIGGSPEQDTSENSTDRPREA